MNAVILSIFVVLFLYFAQILFFMCVFIHLQRAHFFEPLKLEISYVSFKNIATTHQYNYLFIIFIV